jgi:peptidoglycan hydrolase CwlO-like protein
MSATSNPEIAALWKKVEQLDKEIAEIRASLNRLNKIVRANIRQAVWQSIALVISILIATVGGLAYQTSVLDKRFEQIEKRWKESDEKFAARSELSEKNLNTHIEQSEKNIISRFEDLKQEVRARRK